MKIVHRNALQILLFCLGIAAALPIIYIAAMYCGFNPEGCSLPVLFFTNIFEFSALFLNVDDLGRNDSAIMLAVRSLWLVSVITMVIMLIRRQFRHILSIISYVCIAAILLVIVGYHIFTLTDAGQRSYINERQPNTQIDQAAFDCTKKTGSIYEVCRTEQAVQASSQQEAIAICNSLNAYSSNCLTTVAVRLQTPTVCDAIVVDGGNVMASDKTQCAEVAAGFPGLRSKESVEGYCGSFFGIMFQMNCHAVAAQKFNDPTLCDIRNPSFDAQKNCLELSTNTEWYGEWRKEF